MSLNGTNSSFFPITTFQTYSSTQYLATTTEPPLKLFGFNISGLELTIFYVSINVVLLILILIMACRSGAKKTNEAKLRKKQRHKEREEKKIKQIQENQQPVQAEAVAGQQFEVQLAVQEQSFAPDDSVHSQESYVSEFEKKENQNVLMDIHKQQSSINVNVLSVCCGAFVSDIMNRSFIYSAFLVHVWDQGSDLGVIYTWFTEPEGKWKYLGWISIGILLNYRLFSAYSLRKAQRGWRDTFLQILDLQLFVDVFRSFEEVKPTDSLYWIRAMEAVLESCPQILLQFVFLYEETDILVWLSLFGSMASVIFSLLHYTDVVFNIDTSDIEASSVCHAIWLNLKWYIAYASRFLFRLCEVTSRCMVLALIWSVWNSSDQTNLFGAYIVAGIYGVELIFYIFLTQFRIPPWEIAAFVMVNIDLTLTFEGRAGALTKPLRHNPFYVCICKPVAEMFTHVTYETEQYFVEHHSRTSTAKHSNKLQPWSEKQNKNMLKYDVNNPSRQKLLIAPAHYVYRFLESIFELFCVLTYAVVDVAIYDRVFKTNTWTIVIATLTTILTPILYCTVRAFADESKTLERNLIAMVHHGNETKEIIKLIGSGASLKQTDFEGNSIVHACVAKDDDILLKRIIKKYKKDEDSVHLDGFHSRNKKGFTPVLLAAKCGAIDCLKLFSHLEEDVDFNQMHVHSGQAMIHIATEYDRCGIIEYLSSLGDKCDFHAVYSYVTPTSFEIPGYNAIHVAARHNCVHSLDILLQKKVNFRLKLDNGDTAAIVAASRGHTIILQKLYDAGDYFDIQGNFGHTPLYRAALNNHPGTVLVLGRDFNANPNIPDENNVHIVVQSFKSCTFGVLQSLAELGCRFDDTGCGNWLEKVNDKKLTALMWACKFDHPKLVKTLLDSGANKNNVNKLDETAAHHAAAMGSLDCLKLLYSYGANVNMINGANQTPKEKAIQQHRINVVDWFDEIKK